ncbi:DUF485 domain-containing protein [Stutzerimonas nitrititolerans]|uniref:DUF485 domain-containing protein n=1 Tax=Stutzerimonas nitrititolerans TaxID=2482751 RepID=UPI0028A08A81|nr:DUF485 domain-containing protein [Stutzerimonas nitrititolerans]
MANISAQAYEDLYANPRFQELVRKRRGVVLRLLFVSMTFFFLVPILSSLTPDLFHLKVSNSTNFGLWYLLAQYMVGGAVAWRYAIQLRQLDKMVQQLTQQEFRQSSTHSAAV